MSLDNLAFLRSRKRFGDILKLSNAANRTQNSSHPEKLECQWIWKVSKRAVKTKSPALSCTLCPGYSRYFLESTLVDEWLPRSQPRSPFQNFIEHSPPGHHFGKLEHKTSGMAHHSSACLDEFCLNACHRSGLVGLRKPKPSHKVSQVVGEDE